MTNQEDRAKEAADLQQKAEELARERAALSPEETADLSNEEIQKVLHELRVHQIELEIQNEELRTARAEIEAEQARYFDLYDLAPIGYCTLSEKGLILEANLTAATVLGTARIALVKQPISRFILKDDQNTYYLLRKKLFETGEPQEGELRLAKPDGAFIWAHLRATVAQAEDGAPVCRVVISDITERKRAEDELKEKETLVSMIMETSPVGIVTVDKTGSIIYANKRAEEILGLVKNEITSTTYDAPLWHHMDLDGSPLPDEKQPFNIVKTTMNTVYNIQHGITWPDGTVVFLSINASPMKDAHSNFDGMIATLEDITKQKQAEEEREKLQVQFNQAQKMESVGRLAGGVAHDFNNMLMGIMGYTDMCRDEISADHPIREWLDEIKHEAKQSANLTRQLLAFARKQTIVPKVLDLNDTVAGMLHMLRRLIGEDIDLSWEPGAELWSVKLDPGQVDQILANLCINARDAIDGVGNVRIETKNVSIDADYCAEHNEAVIGPHVMLAISDDGCGMDSKTLAQVFEPFFTTKGVGEGTGLGLATVYGIVKQNGGFVDIFSEPGKGTTFCIYLPRFSGEHNGPDEVETTEEHLGGSETLMLVEDEKSVRVTTERFLEQLGYTVLAAEAPSAALRLATEYKGAIELLITDVVMPDMNGRDLAAELSREYPSLKCLFISGYTANVIARRGILEEGVHFLAKPFTRDSLARKVYEILKGKQITSKE